MHKFADQVYTDFSLAMRERAEFSVVTQPRCGRVGLTKFGLVLIRVVELFYPRVTIDTAITLRTLLFLRDVAAEFRRVLKGRPSPVFAFFMVVRTLFQVVVRIV